MTVCAGALTLCCADMDARPLFWTLAGGGRDGYEPRVAGLVAERLGLDPVWEFRRWDRFQPALEANQVDAIWCGSAITAERRRVFSYSRPYAAFDEGVLVAESSSIRWADDLVGRTIGAIAGSTNMRLAETLGARRLVPFDGSSDDVFAEMLDAVASGKIDAMVDDMPAFGACSSAAGSASLTSPPPRTPGEPRAGSATCRWWRCSTTASAERSRAARWPTSGAVVRREAGAARHRRLSAIAEHGERQLRAAPGPGLRLARSRLWMGSTALRWL